MTLIRKAKKNKPKGRIWERYVTEASVAALKPATQLYIRRKWAKMKCAKKGE